MTITSEPINLIIAGVGGQGNLLMSRMIGRALVNKDYCVTMTDDIGVSQRAGAVTSYVRISRYRRYGPMIPEGKAHSIVSLEPLETLRMLNKYGNPKVLALSNIRSIFPAGVLLGRDKYPDLKELTEAIAELSEVSWFIDATDIALRLGDVIVTNIVMLGALVGTEQLPINVQDIEDEIRETMPVKKIGLNLQALEMGFNAINKRVTA
ncbi:indolepyruvate oxidoreductase subunit beta [Chloroflexota bacterium]